MSIYIPRMWVSRPLPHRDIGLYSNILNQSYSSYYFIAVLYHSIRITLHLLGFILQGCKWLLFITEDGREDLCV